MPDQHKIVAESEYDPRTPREHLKIVGKQGTILFRAILEEPQLKKARGSKSVELVGTFEELEPRLQRLNHDGYGIFFQVNAADGKGWKASNIEGVNCHFADFDHTPLENVERLQLDPHLAIETSPGKRHFYWCVADAAVATFGEIQKRLIKVLGSDKSIHDLPRIMRLAGFRHRKTDGPGHPVKIVSTTDAPAYTQREFLAALTVAERRDDVVGLADEPSCEAIASPSEIQRTNDLKRAESAMRHNINSGNIDLGDRADWINFAIAVKASFGDGGFDLFLRLSREAPGFDSAEDCRTTWDSIADDERREQRLTMGTFFAKAKDSGWRYGGNNLFTGDEEAAKLDAASLVLKMVDAEGDERFLDQNGVPFVRFRRRALDPTAPLVVSQIDSDHYRGMLRRRFHLQSGTRTLAKEQLNNAIHLLRAEALETNKRRHVYLRVGENAGRLYVNLGRDDGSAVEIDPALAEGWRVIADPPVLFALGARGALPLPEMGASLVDLERHMPSLARQDVQRALGFCIGCYNPEGTLPFLLLGGGQGTNKSTTADMVLALTDPPSGRQDGRFSFPADERDLVIHALYAHVLCFDNVSSFNARESDRMCKLLSGTAFSTRMLYANNEEQRFALRRPVVATCIGTPTSRGDLIDRTLPITARRTGVRRTEAVVWSAFDTDWPRLFGLVLTGVVEALRNRDAIEARVECGALQPPRLADFAQFVEGAADVLELQPGEFSRLLSQEQEGLQAESAAGDPLGMALVRHFSNPGTRMFKGSASELLSQLETGQRPADRQYWPAANKVRGHLVRLQDGLADLGLNVSFENPSGKSNVYIIHIVVTERFSALGATSLPF